MGSDPAPVRRQKHIRATALQSMSIPPVGTGSGEFTAVFNKTRAFVFNAEKRVGGPNRRGGLS